MYGNNPATIPNISETDLSRRQVLKLITGGAALGLSGVLVGHGRLVMAQGTPATTASYPSVSITAENDGDGYKFGVPDSFPTGYVAVTLVNKSDTDHHAMFMKMNSDVTTDHFIETATTAPDPGALAPLAVSIGGPGSIGPGQQATVIMNLEEGPYVLICEIPGPDGVPHYKMGMITAIDAAPAGTPVTTAPVGETTVDLVDFAFDGLPATLTTGQHIWEVTDTGKQQHELAIMLLSAGVTADAALGILSSSEAPATPGAAAATPAAPATAGPPFVSVAGAAPMSPGQTVWPVLNLAAGDYLTVCFIPDPATGKPHFMLGMSAAFTVA
jgi:hypothetical protein